MFCKRGNDLRLSTRFSRNARHQLAKLCNLLEIIFLAVDLVATNVARSFLVQRRSANAAPQAVCVPRKTAHVDYKRIVDRLLAAIAHFRFGLDETDGKRQITRVLTHLL